MLYIISRTLCWLFVFAVFLHATRMDICLVCCICICCHLVVLCVIIMNLHIMCILFFTVHADLFMIPFGYMEFLWQRVDDVLNDDFEWV